MAMPSLSSSSFSYGFSYDVFLSFRGEDTRHGFIGFLYKALLDRGILTFIDDEELQRGDEIKPSLLKAIEESRITIIVFSTNYASSSFCLDELAKIFECVKRKGRLVLPVFYDVNPSHVRCQTGNFGEALVRHEERFKNIKENFKDNMERLQKWKGALEQAANFSGWHFKLGNEYEHEFVEKIVKEVSDKINRAPLHVADYPVGLEHRVQAVKSLLGVGSDDGVHLVGIYGLGGLGKTTLARAIYNLIADLFEGLCFLDDVREKSMKHGLVHLQEMLLSEIVGEKDIKIGSVGKGISIIKHRLRRKKILLILDDVDKLEQLRAIVGQPNWFGSGSRVIITTRDKHLLASHGVERTYELEELTEEEALELLSWNAFKNNKVDPSYKDISNKVATYASGLPLALELVGSLLFGKSIKEWESALDQYKNIPNKNIQDILKVTYNALEEDHQKIFLDIACCLKGYRLDEVEDLLCAHYSVSMEYGIGVLVDKCLLKIKNGCVTLHELIEAMGKEIDRQESPKELGKRRRLWFHKDIVQVLAENMGTSEIEIICLDFPLFEEDEEVLVEWDGEAFKKMENLKTLIIRNCCFSKGPKHLPNSLRVLEWWTYPLQDLPYDFNPKKLAICKLPESCFTVLELAGLLKKFVNLRVLNLDRTECLIQIPDLSSLPNLEKLSFEFCENLVTIHDSVGFLDKVKILSAFGCSKLRSFPPIKLTSLEELELSSCSSLEIFPEILGKMENMTRLELKHTPIKELPFSFQNFTRLQALALLDCGNVQLPSNIVMLPELAEIFAMECKGGILSKQNKGEEKVSSISSNIKCLCLSGCNLSDEYFPLVFGWFPNVKELELSSNSFTFLPECIKECRSLKLLDLDNCERLREIGGIPPNLEYFTAGNCKSLTLWSTSMLLSQELHEGANTMFCLPGVRIPEWFNHHSTEPSVSFWFRNKFPAITLCFVVGPMGMDSILFRPIATVNGNAMKIKLLTEKRFCFDFSTLTDHILIIGTRYMKFEDNLDKVLLANEWNNVVVSIGIDFEPVPKEIFVKGTGLHVIKQKSNMDDIQFTNPYDQPFHKKKQSFVDIGYSPRQFTEQHTNLVLSEPHVGQGRKLLSLLPPPAFNYNVNWDSNLTRMSSTSSVRGHEIVSQKGKIGQLKLDMGVLQFVQQRKRLASLSLLQRRDRALLDLLQRRGKERLSLLPPPAFNDNANWVSNSTWNSNTTCVQGHEIASGKRKIGQLRLDMGVLQFMQKQKRLASLDLLQGQGKEWVTLLPPPALKFLKDNLDWDSNLMISSQMSSSTSVLGLHKQQYLPSNIKNNYEVCESLNDAKGKEMVECNSNDGEDNGKLMEQLSMTKSDELGREPTVDEIFLKTHTKKKDKSWVDDRSRETYEAYQEKVQQATSQASDGGEATGSVDPSTQLQLWAQSAGGKTRGRLYGVGGLSGRFKHGVSSLTQESRASGTSTQSPTQYSTEVAAQIAAFEERTRKAKEEAREAREEAREARRKAEEEAQEAREARRIASERDQQFQQQLRELSASVAAIQSHKSRRRHPDYEESEED